jgi:AcrR family transcriptional regulator
MRKNNLRIKRNRLRKEQNKKFILEAAERVFGRKGYGLTRVDDIASEAQFSKATLYKYFSSKKEIFMEIISNAFEESEKRVMKIQKEKMSAEDKLREVIYFISSYSQKKKNIARILFMEREAMRRILSLRSRKGSWISIPHPKIPYQLKIKMERIFNIICEIIKEGIESGEFRKVDIKDAAFVFGAMVRGFYIRGPVRDKEYSINESTDLLHSFFLSGVKKDR